MRYWRVARTVRACQWNGVRPVRGGAGRVTPRDAAANQSGTRFMSLLNRTVAARRGDRRRAVLAVEGLETKALMATSTATIATGFIAPDLTPLINQAVFHHVNTGPATIRVMENALQS